MGRLSTLKTRVLCGMINNTTLPRVHISMLPVNTIQTCARRVISNIRAAVHTPTVITITRVPPRRECLDDANRALQTSEMCSEVWRHRATIMNPFLKCAPLDHFFFLNSLRINATLRYRSAHCVYAQIVAAPTVTTDFLIDSPWTTHRRLAPRSGGIFVYFIIIR